MAVRFRTGSGEGASLLPGWASHLYSSTVEIFQ
jgi:hypothetical protein